MQTSETKGTMYTRIRTFLTCISFALLLVPAAGADDLTIVSRVTPSKGSPTTSTQYITATKIRTSDGQFDTIVDVASGKMIHVEHKKKRYYESSFEEMRAHFAELEAMMQSNPAMEMMFGDVTQVQVEKTSESRSVAGYDCQKYVLSLGKNFTFEIWATTQLEFPIEYYDARKMLYASMGPMASRFEKMFEEIKKVGGFTLASTVDSKILGMKVRVETEATEVRKGPIPADAFEPPAGYKKKKSPYQGK